jgi:cupin superfamily acireductone dioxygenase involved in methionine salvage
VAVLRIPDENRSLREHDEVRDYLAEIGIDYERWESPGDLPSDASANQVLTAYSEQVQELKQQM